MTKSSHTGTGDFPQNQNNGMSDDPRDGSRESFTAEGEKAKGVPGAPESQGKERIEQLGRQGSSKS